MDIAATIAAPIAGALVAAIGVLWHALLRRLEAIDKLQEARVEDARADVRMLHEASTSIAEVTRQLQASGDVNDEIREIRDIVRTLARPST